MSQVRPAIVRGLFVIAVVVVAVGLWPPSQPAAAQIPDSGAQRQQQLEELRAMNRKLGEIADLLRDIRDQKKGAGEKDAKETQGR